MMEIGIFFVMGLIVGSFLNVLIYRLNVEGVPKYWQGRSFCPKCKHILSWYDNIPLFSFLYLKGKCRFCHKSISWQYPVVELTTALTFTLIYLIQPGVYGLWLLSYLVISSAFIVIFFSDLIYGLIPDEMVVVGSVATLIYRLGSSISDLEFNLIIGLLSSLGFLLIVLATRFRGMGLGDVKLAFLMGLLLGWPNILVAVWSAFVLGGVVAVTLLLLKWTKLSATIPLGPFLVIGVLISALWSRELLAKIGI